MKKPENMLNWFAEDDTKATSSKQEHMNTILNIFSIKVHGSPESSKAAL